MPPTDRPWWALPSRWRNEHAAAVTGLKGDYTSKVSQGQTLVFSFLGMTTQRHKVGAADVIDVKMAADNKVLDR